MNQLSLVQAVNHFGESVVIAVTSNPDRRLDARIGQTFAIPNRYILLTPVAVVNQGIGMFGLAVIQGLAPMRPEQSQFAWSCSGTNPRSGKRKRQSQRLPNLGGDGFNGCPQQWVLASVILHQTHRAFANLR